MALALEHKTALITGGSSGIGLATAKLFASQGAHVIIVGRNANRLADASQEIGPRATSFAADVSHQAGANSLVDQLHNAGISGLDVLFANAGASNAPELFETTEDAFDAVIDSNLKSTFFSITSLFPLLNEHASVIITSSVGYHRATIGDPLYVAAKAGARALGRGFAGQPEFLQKSIRVNTLSFGAISTPMTGAGNEDLGPALEQWAEENIPMRRWADVSEAAHPALFLASSASSYLTGTEIAVDGGLAQI